MATARADIATGRATRYLAQLCRHAAAMGSGARGRHAHEDGLATDRRPQVSVEWTDTHGVVTFAGSGRVTVTADATTLAVRIDATDDCNLRAIQDLLARDLERFGTRERLEVLWRPDPSG